MHELIWHLRRCQLFSELAPERLQHLSLYSRLRDYPPRAAIHLPTEQTDRVFVLSRGLAKVSYLTPDGRESILAFVEPGALFGDLELCDGAGQDEYVIAVEPSTAVTIPVHQMRQLVGDQPDVATRIIDMLGMRRRRAETRLKNILFQNNRERLVHLLFELVAQFGKRCQKGVRLRISLSHQELANMIGITRESVTLLLGQLRNEGCVEYGRRRLVLTDPDRLFASVKQAGRRESLFAGRDLSETPIAVKNHRDRNSEGAPLNV